MKKSFLGMLVCIAALFSSCLGDNESTYTGGEDFAVIKRNNAGVLFATSAVTGFYLTWDGMEKYGEGSAVALSSYHLNFDNSSGTIVKADYANVSKSFPVTGGGQLWVNSGVADTISNITNKVALTSLSVLHFRPAAEWLDDKWEIAYVYDRKDGESSSLEFVYDATKQKLKGNDLPANTVVVDVFINKNGVGTGATEKKTELIVVNFDKLRTIIAPTSQAVATSMNIHFRFSKEGTGSVYENTSILGGYLGYAAK